MKLSTDIRIPDVNLGAAVTAIRDEFRRHALQVNLVSEGRVDSHYNARSSIPTGPGANGDIVWKKPVSLQGTAGQRYVVIGFVCTVSGNPATWEEMRVLTGN